MSTSVAGSASSERLSTTEPEPLERLVRPAEIEEEIRHVLTLDPKTIAERAKEPQDNLSSECLVHLVRRDLRGERSQVESLLPPLLERADRSLRRALGGRGASLWAEEAREEILGRLAMLLLEPGRGADFFEVRFDLALKRLRIDVCRSLRRRPQATSIDAADSPSGQAAPTIEAALSRQAGEPLSAEARATLSQALAKLEESERRAMILRYLIGLPVAPRDDGKASVASTLGVSERTVRNLLHRARQRLAKDS